VSSDKIKEHLKDKHKAIIEENIEENKWYYKNLTCTLLQYDTDLTWRPHIFVSQYYYFIVQVHITKNMLSMKINYISQEENQPTCSVKMIGQSYACHASFKARSTWDTCLTASKNKLVKYRNDNKDPYFTIGFTLHT